jgi:cellulose biosynthesis protein BcsQ
MCSLSSRRGHEINCLFALVDVGPNLGAVSRSAVIACDHIAVPLAPDIYSLQGLGNLGPSLRRWREEWAERKAMASHDELRAGLPDGDARPIGYVVIQHALRLDRPVQAYYRWLARIPDQYRMSVLGQEPSNSLTVDTDPNCLAMLKHYRSLMTMAIEARKPMFFLKPADGAIGAHSQAVQNCYADFQNLTKEIARRCGLSLGR